MNEGIYFTSFYFRVWDLTREIRENKNLSKISTYTVSEWKQCCWIVGVNAKSYAVTSILKIGY